MNQLNVTLGKYNNSLNFVVGINGIPPEMDVLNNPYFKFSAMSISNTEQDPFNFEEVYELEICS